MDTFISPVLALAIIILISVFLLGFGFYVSKKLVKSSKDYLYAGRNVGLALSTASIIAAWITGNTVMSAPEQGYNLGLLGVTAYATVGLALVSFAPLASRAKKLMPEGYTSGDFIRLRYGRPVWVLFIIISIYYLMVFLVTQSMAGGLLLQALSGLNYKVGMLFIMIVCTIYTFSGGMKAVFGTDFILSLLMLIAVFVAGFWAYRTFGFQEIYEGVMSVKPETFNIGGGEGLMYLGSCGIVACGEIYHSNIWWQRIHSGNTKSTLKSFVIAGLVFFPIPIVAGSLAWIAIAKQYNIPQVNMVFPITVSNVIGPVGSIFVLVIVYSALASTVSSLLTSSANLIAQDLYRGLIKPKATDDELAKYTKFIILGLTIITIALTWEVRDSMYKTFLFSAPAVSALVWPILYGIYIKTTNKTVVFWSIILSMAAGLYGYFFVSAYAAGIFGTLTSFIIIFVGSKILPDKNFKWSSLNEKREAVPSAVPSAE